MKKIILNVTLVILTLCLILGCSSQKSNPVTSADEFSKPSSQLPSIQNDESNYSLLASFEMQIDIESLSAKLIPNRDLSGHFNISSWVSPQITVLGYNPGTEIVDVNLTINNPFNFGGHDVRLIVHTDSAGHFLNNDDGWTAVFDIPGGSDINPFKAFAKSEANYFFEGYGEYTENFLIKCPGANFNVKFAIEASVGGNILEPYLIDNFSQNELADIIGHDTSLSVDIHDWQNDVSAVMLDCPEITGGPFVNFVNSAGDNWTGIITNDTGAPAGNYSGTLMAYSGLNIAYDIVTIEVTHIEIETGYAVQIGGTGGDRGKDIAVDSLGNIILTGYFESEVDFDPGIGVVNKTAWSTDTYLAKYTNYGDLIWVKTWGGPGVDKGLAVAVDQYNYIVVTGNFMGTVDFDPGPGLVQKTTVGNEDIFVSKFNPDGDLQWVNTMGGADVDQGTSVIIDSSQDVFVVGDFDGAVDFNPGPGYDWHTPTYAGGTFLTKFNSNGEYFWTLSWDAQIFSAVENHLNNIYISGVFQTQVDFDPDPIVEDIRNPVGWTDFCLIKLSTNGDYFWADTWGGDWWDSANDLDIDSSENIFLAGDFMDTVDFDPGAGVQERYSIAGMDSFLVKVNSSGAFQWVGTWGGDIDDYCWAVTVDNTNDVYVGGFFNSNSVDFDPGPRLTEINRRGGNDGYISKFDNLGNFDWVRTFGKSGFTVGNELAHDTNNNIFFAGDFYGQTDLKPGPIEEIYLSNGEYDAFYLKIFPNGYWD